MSNFQYRVFLSFKGEEVVNNFVDQLCHELHAKGFPTFKEDQRFADTKSTALELSKALEESSVAVVVLSHKYVASPYCLDELVKILKRKKDTIIPVFYDMSTSDVTNQPETMGLGLNQHESTVKARKWRLALNDATMLRRWNLSKGIEDAAVTAIFKEISQKLVPAISPVAADKQTEKVTNMLEVNSTSATEAGFTGIHANSYQADHVARKPLGNLENYGMSAQYPAGNFDSSRDVLLNKQQTVSWKPVENSFAMDNSATQQMFAQYPKQKFIQPGNSTRTAQLEGEMMLGEDSFHVPRSVTTQERAATVEAKKLSQYFDSAQNHPNTVWTASEDPTTVSPEGQGFHHDPTALKSRSNSFPMDTLATQQSSSPSSESERTTAVSSEEQRFHHDPVALVSRANSFPMDTLATPQRVQYPIVVTQLENCESMPKEYTFQVGRSAQYTKEYRDSPENHSNTVWSGSRNTTVISPAKQRSHPDLALKSRENCFPMETQATQQRVAQYPKEKVTQPEKYGRVPRENSSPVVTVETQLQHPSGIFSSAPNHLKTGQRGGETGEQVLFPNKQSFECDDGFSLKPEEVSLSMECSEPKQRAAPSSREYIGSTDNYHKITQQGGERSIAKKQSFHQDDVKAKITDEISSKSTTIHSSKQYHVLVSYSGENDINIFVGKLCNDLHNQGFNVFKDDMRLENRNQKAQELLKAVAESLVAIIIFTEDFASSALCKMELVKVMNSKKESVIPVYYNVDHLNIHKEWPKFGRNSKEDWKAALEKAAGYPRLLLAKGNEDGTVEDIVQRISIRFAHVISSTDKMQRPVTTEPRVPFQKQPKEMQPAGNESGKFGRNSIEERPSSKFTNTSSGKIPSKNEEVSSHDISSRMGTNFSHASITELPIELKKHEVDQESSTSLAKITNNRSSVNVFLSFTGQDIRQNFIDNLCSAFHHSNIGSSVEDECQSKDKKNITRRPKAIEESRFSVVVFSRNYITSPRCLDQLVKIMDCKKANNQTVLAVYKDIDTTTLRDTEINGSRQDKKLWTEALCEASKLQHFILGNAHRDVEEVIEQIVQEINRPRTI